MTDTTDTTGTAFESSDTDDQRADTEQGNPQQTTTAREFFREKFADGDKDKDGGLGPFIEPKGDEKDEVRT